TLHASGAGRTRARPVAFSLIGSVRDSFFRLISLFFLPALSLVFRRARPAVSSKNNRFSLTLALFLVPSSFYTAVSRPGIFLFC
ncbi:hypothetical protein PFISCL1PPCAC_24565, partial [Pristionchus fissidentatus]